MDLKAIDQEVRQAAEQLIEEAQYSRRGDFFVLGCSSSEVMGGEIGQASNEEVGATIVSALLDVCRKHGFHLAIQGCEHINRALVVERDVAYARSLEEVNVVPQLHAGGSASVAGWTLYEDPICVEHITASLGMDIGDTEIGMHIKHVQRPVRPKTNRVGKARVTALMYRPKLVGGERAAYL